MLVFDEGGKTGVLGEKNPRSKDDSFVVNATLQIIFFSWQIICKSREKSLVFKTKYNHGYFEERFNIFC